METIDIRSIKNYREVGLGFVNGPHDGTINAHWEVWQSNVEFGSTTIFGHCVVLLLALFPLHGEGEF